jgi:polyferredoxin
VRKPRQPDPDVHEIDYRVPAAIGTLMWTVALVVLLALGDGLPASERWWIGVCVTGIVLGVFGFLYIPHLLRRRSGAVEQRADRS